MTFSYFLSSLYLQTLQRDLPPTIISQGEEFKPAQGQSEWSSDESPEDKFLSEEPRLKRRPNLKAGVSHCPLQLILTYLHTYLIYGSLFIKLSIIVKKTQPRIKNLLTYHSITHLLSNLLELAKSLTKFKSNL